MAKGAPSADTVILHAMSDAVRRLTRTRLEEFLVSRGYYSLSTLQFDPSYTGLGKRDLIELAFTEREEWRLITDLADEGVLSEETLAEARNAGFFENDDAPPAEGTVAGAGSHRDATGAPSAGAGVRLALIDRPKHTTLRKRWSGLTQTQQVSLLVAAIGGAALVFGAAIGAIIQYRGQIEAVQVSIHATQTAEAMLQLSPLTALLSPAPLSTAPASPSPSPQPPQALILAPKDGDTVPVRANVLGSLSSLPSGVRVFLCVRAAAPGGRTYPQGEITSSGPWTTGATYQTSGAAYDVFLVATLTKEAAAVLADSHYAVAGLADLPEGSIIVSPAVSVVRD